MTRKLRKNRRLSLFWPNEWRMKRGISEPLTSPPLITQKFLRLRNKNWDHYLANFGGAFVYVCYCEYVYYFLSLVMIMWALLCYLFWRLLCVCLYACIWLLFAGTQHHSVAILLLQCCVCGEWVFVSLSLSLVIAAPLFLRTHSICLQIFFRAHLSVPVGNGIGKGQWGQTRRHKGSMV